MAEVRRLKLKSAMAAGLMLLGPSLMDARNPPALAVPSTPALKEFRAGALPPLPFDHILRYDELTALLRAWAEARPGLIEVESLGVTPGGRDLWFVTITNQATGPALEKPALLVDANVHAMEWTGGVAALNCVWTLLRDYGTDERVTRLVDTRSVYVLPRLSPDGVEATLQEGRILRSSLPSRTEAAPAGGLHMRDIDGDGRVVFMRFRDPNGPWKRHPEEPRLLIARRPDEAGGDCWRVVPEGFIEGFDGQTIQVPPALEGPDFGMSYPDDRSDDGHDGPQDQGRSPVPEIAAYVEAIAHRPNIVAHVTCHTFGGAILTPPVNADEKMPAEDQHVYAAFAAKAKETMGYETMSYLDLRGGEGLERHIPTEIGWLYNIRGTYSFITELWNPLRAAGIDLKGGVMSAWLGGFHPVEDELRLLHWNDKELRGQGFVPWHPFKHPQLGPVEIGGWDKVHFWYNIPFGRLRKEVEPHTAWLIFLALSSPRLEIRSLGAEAAGENLWHVRLVIENTGWLPTNGSERALDRHVVAGISAELSLSPGTNVTNGGLRRSLGQLAGRSEQRSTATWWGYSPGTSDRAIVDWTIAAPAGTVITATARHERAGTARARIVLRPAS